jgi:CheY-like chemotaxis protein
MDGLSSTRHIRNYELELRFSRTRIVALTCFSSSETQAEASLSGMDMFLIKPVPMKALKPILEMDPDDFAAG